MPSKDKGFKSGGDLAANNARTSSAGTTDATLNHFIRGPRTQQFEPMGSGLHITVSDKQVMGQSQVPYSAGRVVSSQAGEAANFFPQIGAYGGSTGNAPIQRGTSADFWTQTTLWQH